jgi:hypothetical protein
MDPNTTTIENTIMAANIVDFCERYQNKISVM